MANYKYSYQNYDKTIMARASGNNLKISLKKTVEVCKAIKGKKLKTAIDFLEKVTKQEAVVSYTRYKREVAHKRGKGIDTGGYPKNVATELLKLIKSAQKNAEERELGDDLHIITASCRKGVSRYHYGRYSGRKTKATHIEIIVGIKENKKADKKTDANKTEANEQK